MKRLSTCKCLLHTSTESIKKTNLSSLRQDYFAQHTCFAILHKTLSVTRFADSKILKLKLQWNENGMGSRSLFKKDHVNLCFDPQFRKKIMTGKSTLRLTELQTI